MSIPKQTYRLDPESELRLEIDFDAVVVVTLTEGLAEVLGLEIAVGKEYAFAGANVAVYSWFGAVVEVQGAPKSAYATSRGETTMNAALNSHSYLETRRDEAAKNVSAAVAGGAYAACEEGLKVARGAEPPPGGVETSALSGAVATFAQMAGEGSRSADCRGPRVLVCGPADSGKSTLCATLCAYAARLGREPVFVELDPGLGDCGAPPGAVAACRVDGGLLSVTEGLAGLDHAALAFWLGHDDPKHHPELYGHVVDALAKGVAERLARDRALDVAGLVINTSHWVDGDGFAALLRAASAFAVDAVLVLAHDRLFADLRQALPRSVAVAKLPRSGGVVPRDPAYRRRARHKKVHEYFYGPQSHVRGLARARRDDASGFDALLEKTAPALAPSTLELPFRAVRVYKVLAGARQDSGMLPVGQASLLEPLQVVAVQVSPALVHNVLAVCHGAADDVDDEAEPDEAAAASGSPHQHLLDRAAAGFVVVTNVNVEAQTVTLLAPCSGDLPSKHLILGKLEWMESSVA